MSAPLIGALLLLGAYALIHVVIACQLKRTESRNRMRYLQGCVFCDAMPASLVDFDLAHAERLPRELLFRRVCSMCRAERAMPSPEERRS